MAFVDREIEGYRALAEHDFGRKPGAIGEDDWTHEKHGDVEMGLVPAEVLIFVAPHITRESTKRISDSDTLKSAQGSRNRRVQVVVDTGIPHPEGGETQYGQPKTVRFMRQSPKGTSNIEPTLEKVVDFISDHLLQLKEKTFGENLQRDRRGYYNAQVALRKAISNLK